ncbi:hypothetical protein [Lysinibacillus sp. NPDC047702]|uniref:hypothetical protein n=1 Tax=unclassified Lysinibacillus TaxID=2636778 RepID=UPI003D014201
MKTIDKQAILDILNSLEVIEQNGGESSYILVENNAANHEKLNALGVPSEAINKYGDEETFCFLALAFSEGYANDFNAFEGGLILEPGRFAVYDTSMNEMSFHDTYKEAQKEYESAKEGILEEAVNGDEQVYILEVKKVAGLIEDKERTDDPAKHGFDSWVKWQDSDFD